MRAVLLATLLLCAPAAAQMDMHGMAMPGMAMPPAHKHAALPAKPVPPGPPSTRPAKAKAAPKAIEAHPAPAAASAPASAPEPSEPAEAAPAGTDQEAGNAAAPAPPADHYADRAYDPAAMARARAMLTHDHGGMSFHRILFNLAEYQLRKGSDGYRWDGEGWFGGDIDRLVLKSEGEGGVGQRLETGEVQALYSHAIGPYFDLQGGVRQDIGAGAKRSYATIGFEGLAPYMFELEGALFLSDHGDLLARMEATYDQRLTQRLILQPRAELNFAAQDVPRSRIGRGLDEAELGLRLRYEIAREFAPYAGVSWTRKVGDGAGYARGAGEDVSATALVLGIRTWF